MARATSQPCARDSNAVLSDLSVHDPLTGTSNRRHGVSLMGQHEVMLSTKSHNRNYTASVGLMLLDVDLSRILTIPTVIRRMTLC